MSTTTAAPSTTAATTHATALVTGGSRGLGRGIVEALSRSFPEFRTFAVARDPGRLAALAREVPRVETIVADAADELSSAQIHQRVRPDVLVLCAGATPLLRPIHQHTWETFSNPWNVDARMAFNWMRDALLLPMRPGGHIVVVSSGAAIHGSPLSGGYAAAKRAQWLIADYAAKEVERLGLGLRIHVLLPQLNPSTEMGQTAIAAYAARAGIEVAEFEKRFSPALTPAIMGQAVVDLVQDPARFPGLAYQISGKGLAPHA